MSSGPENRFRNSIHRLLPPGLHQEKMHNPYRGGTFDDWYSGTKADIWVEYKWDDRRRGWNKDKTVFTWYRPELSALQEKWGRERFKEGRRVFVIVGTKNGGVLYTTPETWEDGEGGIDMTKAEIVAWLVDQTMEISLDGNTGRQETSKRSWRNGKRIQNTDNSGADIRAGKVPGNRKRKR